MMLPCHVHKHGGARAHVCLLSCCVDRSEYYVDAQTQRTARDGQSLLARAKTEGAQTLFRERGHSSAPFTSSIDPRCTAHARTHTHTAKQTQTLYDGPSDNNLSLTRVDDFPEGTHLFPAFRNEPTTTHPGRDRVCPLPRNCYALSLI